MYLLFEGCLSTLIAVCYREKMHCLVLKQVTYSLRKIERFCKKYIQLISLQFN